ncbi:hypothetical protein GCM10017687_24480 [Streptomyces echinatus]|uniref:Uncharacterized protein n=1 Tax=Streptomyces echinatus TaxID=67293 RepID=A0A7W9PSV5_9ACTN|nr:hypothetical protein [Streptomyces echinatus]
MRTNTRAVGRVDRAGRTTTVGYRPGDAGRGMYRRAHGPDRAACGEGRRWRTRWDRRPRLLPGVGLPLLSHEATEQGIRAVFQ